MQRQRPHTPFTQLVPGFLWTWPHGSLPFANFTLLPFAVINHNHDYNNWVLWFLLVNEPEDVLGTLNMVPKFGVVQYFLVIRLRLCIIFNSTDTIGASPCITSESRWYRNALVLVMMLFDHLVKVVSAGFLLCKVGAFFFVINKFLGKMLLLYANTLVSSQTFIH